MGYSGMRRFLIDKYLILVKSEITTGNGKYSRSFKRQAVHVLFKHPSLHCQSSDSENEQQFISLALKLLKDVRDDDVF